MSGLGLIRSDGAIRSQILEWWFVCSFTIARQVGSRSSRIQYDAIQI